MFPGARLEESQLEVVVFPKANLGMLIRFGLGGLTGSIHRFTGVQRWKTQRVELKCSDAVPFELEGDNLGSLPVVFEQSGVLLNVIAP